MTDRPLPARVQITRSELNFDTGAYRAVLGRVGGITSCSDASDDQLISVVCEIGRLGFGGKKGGKPCDPVVHFGAGQEVEGVVVVALTVRRGPRVTQPGVPSLCHRTVGDLCLHSD